MTRLHYPILLGLLSTGLSLCSCSPNRQQSQQVQATEIAPRNQLEPARFEADSAYQFIKEQVALGPRVPGSEAHQRTGAWIAGKLRSWGYSVTKQSVSGTGFHGDAVSGHNIIATLSPQSQSSKPRILLMAHWDTRVVADHDPTPSKRTVPILGADDGGSGVAVLLELARQWQERHLDVDIDFIFFDLEDGGQSGSDEGWCQGSTYWARHPHIPNYKAEYAILLDMVGAKDARFYWEYHSKRHAAPVMRELWDTARKLGWQRYFVSQDGAAALDDHLSVIEHRGIPSVDVINFSAQGEFGKHWHTHADNLDIISQETLKAVGESVATMIERKHSK